MRPELTVHGTATAIEGPLLFLRRNVEVGLNEAVEISTSAAPREARPRRRARRGHHGRRGARIDRRPRPARTCACASSASRFISRSGPACSGACSTASASRPTAARRSGRAQRCASTGVPINPAQRELPQDFIETGVTAIDLMNSLVRGQKLPLFSAGGLPHDRLASEIAQNARLRSAGARRLRHRVRRHRRLARHRGNLPPRHAGFRRARPHRDVPQSRERALDPAAADAALRADGGRISRLRRGPARARHHDRHDQLLRGAARGLGEPRRDPEPQGLSRLHVFGPRLDLRARRLHARDARHGDATADPDHAGRGHQPSDPRPHRLHHRRPGRARPRARPQGRLSADQRAAEPVAPDGSGHRQRLLACRSSGAGQPAVRLLRQGGPGARAGERGRRRRAHADSTAPISTSPTGSRTT